MDLFLTKEALCRLSYVGTIVVFEGCQLMGHAKPRTKHGAGDEARTRDIQLGRLKLYQLSYSRLIYHTWYSVLMPRIHKNHCRPVEMKFRMCSDPGGSHVVRNDPENGYLLHQLVLREWWWGEDSNLRRLCRQIYSLFPLAAREPHHGVNWSQRRDSNPRPTDYKSVALPAELRWHQLHKRLIIKDPINKAQVYPWPLKNAIFNRLGVKIQTPYLFKISNYCIINGKSFKKLSFTSFFGLF